MQSSCLEKWKAQYWRRRIISQSSFMYKTQIKVINSKNGDTKYFWEPTICQYHINTFHMISHSILIKSQEVKIIFHILHTLEGETSCGKDWQTLNQFISLLPVPSCRQHFANSLAGMAMGMSPDQQKSQLPLPDLAIKALRDSSFSRVSRSYIWESRKSYVDEDRDSLIWFLESLYGVECPLTGLWVSEK